MKESAARADAWAVGRRLRSRHESIERHLLWVLERAGLGPLELGRAAGLARGVDPVRLAAAGERLEAELSRDRGLRLEDLSRPAAATKKGAIRC